MTHPMTLSLTIVWTDLRIRGYPRPRGVEHVNQLLDVFLDGQHVLDHHTLTQQRLEVEVNQRRAWRQ